MPKAQVIQATTPFDTRFPLVLADQVTDIPGILWHYEPAHPASGWGTALPASGSVLRNVVRQEAAVTIGGTPDQTDAAIYYAGLTGTTGILERSGKGGIHAAIATTAKTNTGGNGLDGGPGVQVPLPNAIRDYILTHPTHAYAMALFQLPTKAAVTSQHNHNGGLFSSSPDVFVIDVGTNGNFCAFSLRNPSGSPYWGVVGTPLNHYVAVNSVASGVGTTLYAHAWAFGNVTPMNRTASRTGTGGGHVLYASIGIDLTAAGLSAAEWKSRLDGALNGRAVSGDTYTNPGSLG